MKFSDLFPAVLKTRGLSQYKAAEKLNVTRKTVGNWSLGHTSPSVDHAAEVAKTLDFSLDTLKDD
jgi:transcriptional regulator with XRE-family HTH domain